MTTAERALTVSPAVAGAVDIYDRMTPVRQVLAPDLTDQELSLFAMVADRTGLDPFAKQIYAVKRQGRVTFQTGIDGYRSIAARTGLYDGQDEPEYGPVCECGDNRPAGHPEFATVRVYRKGVGRPIGATAYWHEYKPDAGQSGRQDSMWTRMPRVMIAKVAEALALRKAFPYDPERRQGIGADVYTADEMAQAGAPSPTPVQNPRERLAARRAALEAPAEPEPEPEAEDADDMDLRDVAEAVFAEEPQPEPARPEPAKTKAEPVRCDATSPYEDGSGTCAREQGHPGNHKNHDRESW